MGNRAVVQFTRGDIKTQAFYLHWNGGPESVYTFLSVLQDDYYCRGDAAPVRFAQLVGNYFGGCLSIYHWTNDEPLDEDNGVYYVNTLRAPWNIAHAVPVPGYAPSLDGLRRLTASELAKERTAAQEHEYNVKGELRKEIRAQNDRFFLPIGI